MGVTIPSAAGEVLEQYEISNSLRFNDGDNPKLAITPSSEGDRRTWTWSGWVKRSSGFGTEQNLFSAGSGSGSNGENEFQLIFGSDNKLSVSSAAVGTGSTSGLFRDPSAWYHIVLAVDTTDGTAANRTKMYVNGNQETLDSALYSQQNTQTPVNDDVEHRIGKRLRNDNNPFDGYMTEVHLIDGAAKAPTDFGRFDDNGVWIPKRYTGTHGTNGFFLEFKQTGTSANSSGIGADTSGNDNHFAVTNLAATDVTEDTCTNNFATLNPLDRAIENNSGGITLSEGNLEAVGVNGGNRSRVQSTIGVSSGKWYAEFKIKNGNDHKTQLGIIDARGSSANHGGVNHGLEYRPNDDQIQIYDGGSNGASQTSLTGAANNDIVGIALDVDATTPTVQFYLQGSALGNAANYDLTIEDRTFFFYVRDGSDSGSDEPHYVCNFGNIPSTVSSPNTDANGYGKFYYAPPSGYFALCTKNLAEFG